MTLSIDMGHFLVLYVIHLFNIKNIFTADLRIFKKKKILHWNFHFIWFMHVQNVDKAGFHTFILKTDCVVSLHIFTG